jgi:GNAT superfamily N-acetyltransferase
MRIRQAGVEEVALAAPLFDAYRQFYGQRRDLSGAATFLTERLSRGESVLFLALDGEVPTGFVHLYPSFSSVRMRPIWILNDLFVAETARRRGVARQLMDAARKVALSTGASRVRVDERKRLHHDATVLANRNRHFKLRFRQGYRRWTGGGRGRASESLQRERRASPM